MLSLSHLRRVVAAVAALQSAQVTARMMRYRFILAAYSAGAGQVATGDRSNCGLRGTIESAVGRTLLLKDRMIKRYSPRR
jgi:hypothetical protein